MKVSRIIAGILAVTLACIAVLVPATAADKNGGKPASTYDRTLAMWGKASGTDNQGPAQLNIYAGLCSGAPNSASPSGALLSMSQVDVQGDLMIRIHVEGLLSNESLAIAFGAPSTLPGSLWNGQLCEVLFSMQHMGVFKSSPTGTYDIDIPQDDFISILESSSMSFQCVYRDPNVGQGGNLSNSIRVDFL